jgi:hypothetical protein
MQNHAHGVTKGSLASANSKKTERKLTGLAGASLEELLLDSGGAKIDDF